MIGSLPKLIALLMALLLVGSTFVGGIIYFIIWEKKRTIKIDKIKWLQRGASKYILWEKFW